jgi:hypothetical protein
LFDGERGFHEIWFLVGGYVGIRDKEVIGHSAVGAERHIVEIAFGPLVGEPVVGESIELVLVVGEYEE